MGLLRILYQDETLVAIDKPCGLLVHRTRIARDHTVALQLLRDQLGRFVYPVHRLDRPTSGVLLFALEPETASRLGAQFSAREVTKTYLGVVRGFTEEQGVIDYPLREQDSDARQEAVTEYRRLATAELAEPVGPNPSARCSLVEAHPQTGRMHQIRRHFKHVAHPVIGDTQYGDGRHNRLFRDRFNCYRLLLFAQGLALKHPATGNDLLIRAPLPEEMASLFEQLGWGSFT
ncbi:MAG: pseudouridylate synthase [Kiritimatiellae bacterium]|nr:pseudouridylate synthase [Kiritimatiellia bacterium]